MPKLIVTKRTGEETVVEAKSSVSVMENIRDSGIDEILALCGGSCSCGTCHCYVDEAWLDKTGTMSTDENDLLDTSDYRKANSRLSCQIQMSPALDGLRVTIAPET